MKFRFSEELFMKIPVVGILRGYDKSVILSIIERYVSAGFTNIEVTMNTPDVATIISEVADKWGGRLNIGAGTVCSIEDLDKALGAGAQFIVCPTTDVNIIQRCKVYGIPIFPGAFTPSEIFAAWKAGARMVKLFPAGQLGPQYVKDVRAPLDQVEIMPTGGVSLDNIAAYKEAGVKAFGMGSLLFNKALIQEQDWDGLEVHLLKVKSVVLDSGSTQ